MPGAVLTLNPSADTSLIETAPTNNSGGQVFFNAGSNLHTNRNHGLLKFNLAGQIPPGSKIRSAALTVTVMQQGVDMPDLATFYLHRMLKDWGEGNKFSLSSPGQGLPAGLGEATWRDRFALTTNAWGQPGGAPDLDYSAAVSAEQEIRNPQGSPYTFFSTPALVADVQAWVNNPAANFGWMLMPADESIPVTAKRIASREDTNNAPVLAIDFVPPPQLSAAQISSNHFSFRFDAEAGQGYLVQFLNQFSSANAWNTLVVVDPPPTTSSVLISDVISTQRFYRVTAP